MGNLAEIYCRQGRKEEAAELRELRWQTFKAWGRVLDQEI